jgi:TolB-like protein
MQRTFSLLMLGLLLLPTITFGDDKAKTPAVVPLAIFPFQERGTEVKGQGAKVTDILFAELVAQPELLLVDREELLKTVAEQELSLSGIVNPAEANKVGHLTGAKVLITGSILQTDKTVYVVAKIIGSETSRVLGASAKGMASDKLDVLVADLAKQITTTINERSEELLPKVVAKEDRLAKLKESFPKGKRPVVFISVPEGHFGTPVVVIDPAVQTELSLICKELGFEVLDPETAARSQADVIISGEGFSETAGRLGGLITVKSRVELKVVERATNRIIAVDRETDFTVDLTEQIAGKKALQNAAFTLAERVLPKLIEHADPKGEKKNKKDQK